MQPCEQEQAILNISKTLDRMEEGQKSIVDLLKIVSNQTPRIEHLEEHSERTYKEMDEVFTRLREVEMVVAASGPSVREQFHDTIDIINKKLDKLNRFFSLITSKPAYTAYTLILSLVAAGTILDAVYHFQTLKAVYLFLK